MLLALYMERFIWLELVQIRFVSLIFACLFRLWLQIRDFFIQFENTKQNLKKSRKIYDFIREDNRQCQQDFF